MHHIGKLFDYYGENDDFFDEYVQDVIKNDLDKTLICFRDLVNQLNGLPKRKDASNANQLQGMQNKLPSLQRSSKLQPIKP